MIKVLAIETSCERGSAALLTGDACLSRMLDGHVNHSERILDEIRGMLSETALTLPELDAIAFSQGPGAFTGLRLACGVAQGLALGAGLEAVVPVSSLAALAYACEGERIFAATDARMGEVYYATFIRQPDGSLHASGESVCCAPEDVVVPEGEWVGVGSAFAAYAAMLCERFGSRLLRVDADRVPRAEDVARLAVDLFQAGGVYAPEMATLSYVRNKVAYTTAERLARGGKG